MNTHLQYKAAAMDLGDASFDAFDAEEGAEASRELSLALWEKSLQDAVDRTTLSLQRLQAAKAAETRCCTCSCALYARCCAYSIALALAQMGKRACGGIEV